MVWLHGIADDVALSMGREHHELGKLGAEPETLCALIGYGQGGDPKTGDARSAFTAKDETVELLCRRLTRQGMTTLPTHSDAWNFRGRDAKRLNQWFRQLGYGLERVDSIQLEIKEKGHRDSGPNAVNTGQCIADALAAISGGYAASGP